MHILFLTPRFPCPPIKGDSLRAYYQIRELSREHNITLLSLTERPVGAGELAHVAGMCERVEVVELPRWRSGLNMALGLASREPLQVRFYGSGAYKEKLDTLLSEQRFDLMHAALIRMLPYVWQRAEPPVVVDLIDSLALNLSARIDAMAGPLKAVYRLELARVRRYERAALKRFPALFVSSRADKEALGGHPRVSVLPNGVDTERFSFEGQESREEETLIFTGNMGYGPNEEAVLWFAGEVWPVLRREKPNARFLVVGTNPGAKVRALGEVDAGIEVLGEVPDVAAHLRRAMVAVCPMRSGSGIQNKVLEAMSAGAPVVATPIANRGVGAAAGRDVLVAESAFDFAEAVLRLLRDKELRVQLATAGRALVEREFRWEEHARRLSSHYLSVSQRLPVGVDPHARPLSAMDA